jgi:hypothetical protein
MGDGIWEMGYGRWDMGDGIWEMGDGRWEMGDGIWGLLPSPGLSSPEGASPIFNLPCPMLSSKEQKKGAFRVFIYFREGGMTEGGSNAELFISYLQYGAKSFLQRFIAAMASLASSFSAVSPGYLN